ncbi:hypothetical protein C2R22_14255 [Salinigranum rubrum]|uniref:Uncharacterized protein n=1 Tax=Salinigranum rubrum TaxID=755307 RepID=A0A2I8VNI6_9EURY|nr:hypothetical protein [Salinigranum rubrum]AUV82659.1 hypothetical protein C2R22_14255 [Salinigranum rubrum]
MSTTPNPTDSTPTTDHTDIASTTADRSSRERTSAGAPMQFSTTNRAPLPPAFGDESWATGEP